MQLHIGQLTAATLCCCCYRKRYNVSTATAVAAAANAATPTQLLPRVLSPASLPQLIASHSFQNALAAVAQQGQHRARARCNQTAAGCCAACWLQHHHSRGCCKHSHQPALAPASCQFICCALAGCGPDRQTIQLLHRLCGAQQAGTPYCSGVTTPAQPQLLQALPPTNSGAS